jgi:hypothetical protein
MLSRWIDGVADPVDLADEQQEARIYDVVDDMSASVPDAAALLALERELAEAEAPVAARLAAKLARSRAVLTASGQGMHVSVVFAVYKEHGRLRPPAEHPHGEDALMRKIRQLDWVLGGVPGASWDMYVVDDGCPEGSGAIARDILERRHDRDNVHVLQLADAIERGLPVAAGLASPADSQKGGAVLYGMSVAAAQPRDRHVVLFTDADLSTHLGQVGLLAHEILGGGADAAIGSRREPLSVAVKRGARNIRGKLFIYLWKRLLPALRDVVDTQCGFKAFRADVARDIVTDAIEKRFAFDIELLVKVELRRGGGLVKVPVAWIDSEAASTTADLQPYLSMLRSIVAVSKAHVPQTPVSEAFAAFVHELDEAAWQRLVERVPAAIAEREPSEFGAFDEVTVEQLRSLL